MITITKDNLRLPTKEELDGNKDGKISFSDVPQDGAFSIFKELSAVELETERYFSYIMKGMPTEFLEKVFKFVLESGDYVNPSILTNLLLLIKSYNTLDDSFFESESVFFSSMEDFIDLKMNLKADIRKFNSEVVKFFFSCMKSLNKFDTSFMDNPVEIPDLHLSVLMSMDIFTLSSMVSNMDDFSTKELVFVEDAFSVVAETCAKVRILDGIYGMMSENGTGG